MTAHTSKYLWLTDIHLNFVCLSDRLKFYKEIESREEKEIFITGDISESASISYFLREMSYNLTNKKITFVLGNHDYYRGSIKATQIEMINLSAERSNIFYLNDRVTGWNDTYIIGCDSFADGKFGDYNNSHVIMNDHRLILEFQKHQNNKPKLLKQMQKLANFDTNNLYNNLHNLMPQNCSRPEEGEKIIILTHVPPFAESCLFNKRPAGEDYLPFYSCKAMGDVLLDFAKEFEYIQLLVLCGHTHEAATYQPLPNLTVRTGVAEYGHPRVEIVEF